MSLLANNSISKTLIHLWKLHKRLTTHSVHTYILVTRKYWIYLEETCILQSIHNAVILKYSETCHYINYLAEWFWGRLQSQIKHLIISTSHLFLSPHILTSQYEQLFFPPLTSPPPWERINRDHPDRTNSSELANPMSLQLRYPNWQLHSNTDPSVKSWLHGWVVPFLAAGIEAQWREERRLESWLLTLLWYPKGLIVSRHHLVQNSSELIQHFQTLVFTYTRVIEPRQSSLKQENQYN